MLQVPGRRLLQEEDTTCKELAPGAHFVCGENVAEKSSWNRVSQRGAKLLVTRRALDSRKDCDRWEATPPGSCRTCPDSQNCRVEPELNAGQPNSKEPVLSVGTVLQLSPASLKELKAAFLLICSKSEHSSR